MSKGAFQSRIVGEGYEQPDQLLANPMNWRKHPKAQQDALEGMLRTVGWVQRVIVNRRTGHIVDGHLRVEVALRRDEPQVPVLYVDLTADEERVVLAAIDPIGGMAETDQDMLDELLTGLETGDKDLDDFLQSLRSDDAEIVEGLTDEDSEPEPPVEPVTKPGDVWLLGKHRLMCGDSTSIEAVEKLMDGQKADMVFTDPPYNIGYQDMGGVHDKIANDKMGDAEFLDFLRQTIMPCEVMYVCCSWQFAHIFKQAMLELGRPPKSMIVWDKINPAQNLDLYFKQHEIIFYHGPFGGQKTQRGDVWQVKRQRNTVHPTMKPVELIELALNDHPSRKIVYDGFGGSGSTMIACEKVGKSARLMELEPRYCDVIVKRWQEFTGKQATLEATGAAFDEISNSASAAVTEIE